jgi:undecaprenyl-diphosphatase
VEALRRGAELADPYRTNWVDGAARDIAGLGGPAMLALIVAAAIAHLFFARGWGPAALLLMAVFGGAALAVVLKLSFGRTGLTFSPGGLSMFSTSFPSANAVLSAIIYPTLGAVLAVAYGHRMVAATLLAVAAAATLLIGLSRALLGMHLPTDVLAGWCAGIAWAALCWIVMRRARGGSRVG